MDVDDKPEPEQQAAEDATDAEPSGQAGDPDSQEPAETEDEPEMVTPEVNAEVLEQLKDMGFGHERAVRAIHFSGNSTLEGALNWLSEHAEDTDLDEPLLVPKIDQKSKPKLTPEEAKAKAAELAAKARARREEVEKVSDVERERQRIQMGKEMAAAFRIEQEQKVARLAAQRQKEKEEKDSAMAKMRAQLQEDRKARRKQLGLPEELTPEEEAAEQRKHEEEMAAAEARRLPVKPVAKIARMRDILVQMKKEQEQAAFTTCCKTLTAYCRNVYMNMDDLSKRKIKLENKALQTRVASMPGGIEFLHLVGFQELDGFLVMQKGNEQAERKLLEGAADVLDSALNNPLFGQL